MNAWQKVEAACRELEDAEQYESAARLRALMRDLLRETVTDVRERAA